MKIVSTNLKTASIRVSKKLNDIIKVDASFVSQIPARHASVQTEPLPYFIFEQEPLKRIVYELKEKEMKLREPNRELVQECNKIFSFILKENPVLLCISVI